MTQSPRLTALDQARGIALMAMTSYHFVFDLDLFGLVPSGTALSPFMRGYAMAIAGSFLFLSGISMVLAHGKGPEWRAFWRRWLILSGAAALVSLATFFAFGDQFVFWGILHMMAAASLVGIIFAGRASARVLALAGVAAILAGAVLRLPIGTHPALWITGLQESRPVTVDYLPIFPWIGPYLLGMAWAQWALARGRRIVPPVRMGGRIGAALSFVGRHSLVYYLAHQPLLLTLIWVYVWL
ncbi:DUF1624 domain-containing protein [Rhodobacteraceae bacterium XHP0102]|nr:DUF1624 domain-containing protein [Rhodobacteraceae bacterium XHP0102]